MPSFQLTNQVASQALRGEDALITLNQTQQPQLLILALGNKAVVSSSGAVGYISEIDTLGYTFNVKPVTPDNNMASVSPGVLLANEIITITQ